MSAPFSLRLQALAKLPGTVRGALWMASAALCFAIMITLVRHLSSAFDPLQIVFFRNLFGLMAMMPWLFRMGLGVLHTERLGLHGIRAIIGLAAMTAWFTTLTLLPLAEATALSFTAPIFTSVLAVLFLGEVMRLRRWTATLVGFAGALVIVRPSVEAIDPASLLAIGTAVMFAAATILVKHMARTESPGAIVTYMLLFVTPASLIPAAFVWVTPDLGQLLLFACLGIFGSIGHTCLAEALRAADATAVVPFDYLRLPLVALFAYLLFAEVPDLWTWIGGSIIAASSIYIAHREATLRRATSTAPPS